MVSFYDGRNLNTLGNSNSKCLMENWVEERATEDIDKSRREVFDCGVNLAKLKDAHCGILSAYPDQSTYDLTTQIDHYRDLKIQPKVKGARAELVERMLMEKALEELVREKEAELNKEEEMQISSDYNTTFNESYNKQFTPTQPLPTNGHDYRVEQPITFWSDHAKKIHGVSQSKLTFDSPFRKNAAFSTPTELQWQTTNPPPYERDHFPNM